MNGCCLVGQLNFFNGFSQLTDFLLGGSRRLFQSDVPAQALPFCERWKQSIDNSVKSLLPPTLSWKWRKSWSHAHKMLQLMAFRAKRVITDSLVDQGWYMTANSSSPRNSGSFATSSSTLMNSRWIFFHLQRYCNLKRAMLLMSPKGWSAINWCHRSTCLSSLLLRSILFRPNSYTRLYVKCNKSLSASPIELE